VFVLIELWFLLAFVLVSATLLAAAGGQKNG
jgi:hypothetical protein